MKILDFGLGRLIDEHRSGTRLTREGEILGTVSYISPEQASDAREADGRSDIYSLGCTFFFLLSGFPPFRGTNPLAVLNQHKAEPPPPLGALRPDVPAEIAGLVERMLAKDPGARPQTPEEILSALAGREPAGDRRNGSPGDHPPAGGGAARRRSGLIPILLSPAALLPLLTLLACLIWLLYRR